jgi:hypothetical protein
VASLKVGAVQFGGSAHGNGGWRQNDAGGNSNPMFCSTVRRTLPQRVSDTPMLSRFGWPRRPSGALLLTCAQVRGTLRDGLLARLLAFRSRWSKDDNDVVGSLQIWQYFALGIEVGSWPARISANYSDVLWQVDNLYIP